MGKTKGIYVLVLSVGRDLDVDVGSLGAIHFNSGLYAYIGSAQNNLERRVIRHFSREKRLFWHIDYLLKNEYVKIQRVFFKAAPKTEECLLAKDMNALYKPIKGFGSSDCTCISHLFKIESYENLDSFLRKKGLATLKL
ncbi:MAG: GIY-YIG nuclease family protein [Candidatus Bathyarchaeota archaeon]|nr:GIY-YIG nuclease family protein [Candidatus Bathyarchaeota archaeon]